MKPFGKTGTVGCSLSSDEQERYSRQLMLSDNGLENQLKLKNAQVLVVGAGGLGSAVLPYLAGAGIGHIGIVDNDVVSLSNLQRQILYQTSQIGKPKVEKAKNRLLRLNPEIFIEVYPTRFTEENALLITQPYHLIVDCTDNLTSRYVIDKVSQQTGIPFIYGSLSEYEGQVSVFNDEKNISYSDVFTWEENESTQPQGVFGALPGIVGSIQAMQAILHILGEETLSGNLLLINAKKMDFQKIKIG